jgi:hypothetical protein
MESLLRNIQDEKSSPPDERDHREDAPGQESPKELEYRIGSNEPSLCEDMSYELGIAPDFDHTPRADPAINFHESPEQDGSTKSFTPVVDLEITPEIHQRDGNQRTRDTLLDRILSGQQVAPQTDNNASVWIRTPVSLFAEFCHLGSKKS